MGIGSIIKTGVKWGLGAGAVTMYYQAGLWKSADETIRNYDTVKAEANGFVNSVPVLRDLVKDVANYGSSLVSPVTKTVSDFRRDWLTFDWSWTRNKDGIVKPAWNSAVAASCDFMAHSPQTLREVTAAGYQKASDYMNSNTISSRTTATVTPSSSSTSDEKLESKSSIKQ